MAARNSTTTTPANSDSALNPFSHAFQSMWSHSRSTSRAQSRATSPSPRASSVNGRQSQADGEINPYSYAFKSVWDRMDSRTASRNASRAVSRAASPVRKESVAKKDEKSFVKAIWNSYTGKRAVAYNYDFEN